MAKIPLDKYPHPPKKENELEDEKKDVLQPESLSDINDEKQDDK